MSQRENRGPQPGRPLPYQASPTHGAVRETGTQPQLCSLEEAESRSHTLPSLGDPVPPPPAKVRHSLIDRCTRAHRDLGQQAGEKHATSCLLARLPDPHPTSKAGQMCA